MANIFDYIKKYGDKTFEEKTFNEVDNLIFSSLSYIDYKNILISKKITIQECAEIFFDKYTKKEIKNFVLATRDAIDVLESIKDTNRYKDLILYNYTYQYNDDLQFSCLFIEISKKLTYISFEGTNDLVSGWKEDFELAYKFPIASQAAAIKYINSHISPFSRRKYIVGGHSKGGNIALVASMYANALIRNKIVKVYSNDGPGILKKEILSKQYERVLPKYELIIPDSSVVGLLLRHKSDYVVVKSSNKGLMAHELTSWQIDEDHFKRCSLSMFSKRIDKSITEWLETYDLETREKFVKDLFSIFKRAKIKSLLDLKGNKLKNTLSIIKESSKLSKESKKMINDLIRFIVLYINKDVDD